MRAICHSRFAGSIACTLRKYGQPAPWHPVEISIEEARVRRTCNSRFGRLRWRRQLAGSIKRGAPAREAEQRTYRVVDSGEDNGCKAYAALRIAECAVAYGRGKWRGALGHCKYYAGFGRLYDIIRRDDLPN